MSTWKTEGVWIYMAAPMTQLLGWTPIGCYLSHISELFIKSFEFQEGSHIYSIPCVFTLVKTWKRTTSCLRLDAIRVVHIFSTSELCGHCSTVFCVEYSYWEREVQHSLSNFGDPILCIKMFDNLSFIFIFPYLFIVALEFELKAHGC
jgi:hypothetical protein